MPSDAAFESLPPEELQALAVAAISATSAAPSWRARRPRQRIAPNDLAGKRISVTTLDGRPLVIDATGEEVMVGDAEALDVRTLPDGRVLFVLDHAAANKARRQAPWRNASGLARLTAAPVGPLFTSGPSNF